MDDIDTENIKFLMQNDPAASAEEIKEYLEKKNNTPLNIAITGEAGSGKSTFINYFRGMTNDEEGAAPTGCTETTFESSSYPHPKYPNVVLWDLPGIGTTSFPADEYLRIMGFEKFDFFIIISDTRFKENDVKLAKAIQEMKKKFYFVRSKIDNDLNAEKKSKQNFNAEETLKQIKQSYIQGLEKAEFESPQVFLISSFDLHLCDFSLLHETLDRELPEHKRHALLMAMQNINMQVKNKKKEALQSQIKYYAAASAAGTAVPVPGVSIKVDLDLMVKAVRVFMTSFGLDVKSLDKLADSTGVPVTDLTEFIKSLLVNEIAPPLITRFFGLLRNVIASIKGEEWHRCIQIIGIPSALILSFVVTYKVLSQILNMLAKAA